MPVDSGAAVRQADIGFLFQVTILGLPLFGDFMEVSHMRRQHEPFVYHEGGRDLGPHVLFGHNQQIELVLKWGLMDRMALFAWMNEVRLGGLFRKDGAVWQFPRLEGSAPLRVYTFTGAWPLSWKGPDLNSNASEVAIEELRLVVNTLNMIASPV
jgi:phage tail-like protein